MHLYGTTETAPIATIMAQEETLLDMPQARSCGQPAIGVEVRVLDEETGRTAAAGAVGEVLIRGENVMAGYWNKPEATAAAMVDGWYRTGDLGYMDERSFLYLVDRAKDMIVSGGENVYSTEVEEVLYGHPAVLEAAVFGIPDARWGEAVHAVVVPRGEVAEADLLGALPWRDRRLQDPQAHRAEDRAAAQVRRRQGAQARTARAVLDGPRVESWAGRDPRPAGGRGGRSRWSPCHRRLRGADRRPDPAVAAGRGGLRRRRAPPGPPPLARPDRGRAHPSAEGQGGTGDRAG